MKDLLVVGGGRLGSRIACSWKTLFPKSRVLVATRTSLSHDRLVRLGLQPALFSDLTKLRFPNIVFCLPPSKISSTRFEIRQTLKNFDGRGSLVLISSLGIESEGESAVPLEEIENLFLDQGACVVRLAGLYGEGRGPHLTYIRQKESDRHGGKNLQLIQIDDAAKISVAALQRGEKGEIYRGCDDTPLTREELTKLSRGSCRFLGEPSPQNSGEISNNEMAWEKLNWRPLWKSFSNWLQAGSQLQLKPREQFDFSSYIVSFKAFIPTKEAYFFLHGFPANRSGKNLDLAEGVRAAVDQDCYIIHYRGLGNAEGAFRFSHSVNESIRAAKEILSFGQYEKIHIYGHSWGTVVASRVARELGDTVKTLILACPITKMATDDPVLTGLVIETAKEMPGVFGLATFEDVREDLEELADKGQPWTIAPLIDMSKTRVAVIQALQDTYTPPEKTRQFLNRFTSRPEYIELDLDHSFVNNRQKLIDTLVGIWRR